jgi:thiamine-phosphate pyrophosphorylase
MRQIFQERNGVKLTERAQRLNLASGRADLPPVILMSDVQRLPDPGPLLALLSAGCAVLVRHPDIVARRTLAERLLPQTRARGLKLLVSDDIPLARALGADGLHLPERRMLDSGTIRRRWSGLLTAAAHSPRALQVAGRIGCDAAILSPVFPTASHPGRPPIGLSRFLVWSRAAPLPIYALGGVTAANVGRLGGANVVGVAAIGGLQTE